MRLALLITLLVGCKAPPEAPTQLEELAAYVFAHAWDDDTEELEAGVVNLDAWLSKGGNLESTIEGYQITQLDQETVDAIDDNDRSVSDLIGASVAHQSAFSPRDLTYTLVMEDQSEVFPKIYDVYEREYDSDPSCFPGHSCTELEAAAESESSWAGLIRVVSKNHIQFRWVETEVGWAMVHRSWLTEPADVSYDGVKVHAQYFLAVTLPDGDGAVRMQATWIDSEYGALPVSEDYAKQLVVNSMQKQGDTLEEWLEEN